MKSTPTPEFFMEAALREARKGLGKTSPNPAVGAVLVYGEKIVARGFHRQAGKDHAEVDCLRKVRGQIPAQARLYVTLEPCSSRGRTAPCADYLVARGVRQVIIGTLDPNPKHSGRAVELLRSQGVMVEEGVLADRCAMLNEAFNKWIVTGRPFVIAKCGMSLDGRLTRPPGETRFLTSAPARADARKLRGEVDAVLIGAETARRDDPRLTVRGSRNQREPLRVIVTRSGRLPKRSNLWKSKGQTLVLHTDVSLATTLENLGQREITSVLLEGGGDILSQALEQRLIDKFQIYLAPIFTAGATIAFGGEGAFSTASSLKLRHLQYCRIADDVRVIAYPAPGV